MPNDVRSCYESVSLGMADVYNRSMKSLCSRGSDFIVGSKSGSLLTLGTFTSSSSGEAALGEAALGEAVVGEAGVDDTLRDTWMTWSAEGKGV